MAMNINPDWAAEIGNRDVRMKETTQPSQGNTGNHGGGVFASGWDIVLGAKNSLGSSEFQKKAGIWMEKSLRLIGAERKSRKNVHLDRGQETKWEISI